MNVPALLTVIEDVVAPLLQTNVVFEEAVAVSITEVVVHVNTLSAPALTVGGVISWVTTTTSEAVQPFPVFVAVTVNVPALLTGIDEVVAPLLQTNVVFEEAVAVSSTEVVVQVNTLSAPALTVGGVMFWVTTTTSEAVQPFPVFVAVTVNVPALLTGIDEVVAPLLQTNVVFEEAVAVSSTEVVVQVNTLSAPALTVGGVLLSVTTATSEAEHPFIVSVAVTV